MSAQGPANTCDDDILTLLRKTFYDEATACLAEAEASLLGLESTPHREEKLCEIFRSYHSVKGSSASVGFDDIAAFGHVVEDCLSALRSHPHQVTCDVVSLLLEANDALKYRVSTALERPDGDPDWRLGDLRARLADVTAAVKAAPADGTTAPPASPGPAFEIWDETTALIPTEAQAAPPPHAALPTLSPAMPPSPAPNGAPPNPHRETAPQGMAFKIEAAKVDAVMDMVGELVVIKSQMVETLSRLNGLDAHAKVVIGLLDKSVRELHEKTLAMRMLSLKTCFLKMQRMARDLSRHLAKPVDFQMSGEDTELDRALIERISDPLMHLCRNAIDHGIEDADARRAAGKAPSGKVMLRAYRRGECVMIEVLDDGGGISRARVLEKAKALGLIPAHGDLRDWSDAQVFDFLFQPGFSTARVVTDISGRGVGLDVVKSNITSMKGRIEVESQEGIGTCFRIAIPLTTAITDGIIVEMGAKRYVLPVECVKSFVESRSAALVRLEDGKKAIGVGGKHHALLDVPELRPRKDLGDVLFVLIDVLERTMALPVDGVHGKTQVVLKALGGSMKSAEYFSGAAVMGDGRVALVLDAIGLLTAHGDAGKAAS